MIRPQKVLQLETLLGVWGVPQAAGGKHSPRTSSLFTESHSDRAARNFCENSMVFRGLPPPGLLGIFVFLSQKHLDE